MTRASGSCFRPKGIECLEFILTPLNPNPAFAAGSLRRSLATGGARSVHVPRRLLPYEHLLQVAADLRGFILAPPDLLLSVVPCALTSRSGLP